MPANSPNQTAVLIGGGTGAPSLLKSLRSRLPGTRLAIVCSVADSGRSTGSARRLFDIPAPGDLRHCLSTLTNDQDWADLMELRLQATQGTALEGMAVGNLILGTLTQSVGNIGTATRSLSELLSVTEPVLPASVENIHLRAVLDDGREIAGELDIRRPGKAPIRRMTVHPATARVWKDTEIMLGSADVVILGPGSLWTSLGAVLAVPGVTAAIADSGAKVVFICNTTTQPGQTDGLDLVGHVNIVSQLLNRVPAVVIANSAPITDEQFSEAGLMPVRPAAGDAELLAGMNSTLIAADLIGSETLTASLWQKLHTAYHDMDKLAEAIVSIEPFTAPAAR